MLKKNILLIKNKEVNTKIIFENKKIWCHYDTLNVVSKALIFFTVATGQSQEEREEGEEGSEYIYEYEYEYEDYDDVEGGTEDGGDTGGDDYELSSPPPTLSQFVPPTQSIEELLLKGTNTAVLRI